MAPKTPLSEETAAAIRASATCLTWKRAGDLPPQLRVLQGKCPTSGAPSIQLSYVAVFPPAGTPLRGVVLFVHGINEHCERYFHLFEDLCSMGFGTIAYDLRSHGKSQMDVPGLVGHVERFPELINDTNDFLTFAKREIYAKMGVRQDEKLVIMGMSLGTLVSVHTVLSKQHTFAGIVLAAPAVSVEMTFVLSVMKLVSGLLSTLLPRARLVPGVNEQWLCRDPLRLADYKADPLTTSEPVTCRMGAETLASMEELQRDLRVEDPQSPFCAVPLLMIMGSEDKVTSLPVAKQFYDRLATRDKQFELVDGAFHALVDDFDRPRVVATIQQWLFQRFPLPAK